MARTHRSHLPGAVFHLTARTQGREPWFTGVLRTRIVEYMASSLGVSDSRLLAYAVMPNHIHLVVQQGEWPLGRVMQPLLRRIAGLVQRSHGIEGHVFERRFRDSACLDPDYVRAAIVYTNLNPVRARLVERPAAYRWTSHGAYLSGDGGPPCMRSVLATEVALGLFAPRDGLVIDELRRAYVRYVGWRTRCDRHRVAERLGQTVCAPPPPPPVWSGDMYWSRTFAPLFRASAPSTNGDPSAATAARPDLRDIAIRTLAVHAPTLPLERIRSGERDRVVVRARRAMVPPMSDAGYSVGAIARYLRVSGACVSRILAADRRAARQSAR